MASFADVLKKAVTQSANAGVKAAQKSSPRAANNTRARDDRGAQAQPAQNWGPAPIVPPTQMMQAPVNQEEESEENSEDLGQTFGSIAKKIAESPAGSETQEKFNQENTMTDAELRSKQAPWDQLLSAVGLGPEIAYADTAEEQVASGTSKPEEQKSAESDAEEKSGERHYLPTAPISYMMNNPGGYTYDQWAAAMEDQNKMNFEGLQNRFQENWNEKNPTPLTLRMPIPLTYAANNDEGLSYDEFVEKYSDEIPTLQIYNPLDFYDAFGKAMHDTYFDLNPEGTKQAGSNSSGSSNHSGRGERNTFLSDYYDYLETPEGKEWAKQYEDLGYADDEVGLANLLASGDIDAVMQLLGASDGWNGSTRLRARYNNSIPDFYDWRSGEFNDNARDMLADYLWGDQAISPLGLAEGTDYLSRTLSPEDAALLAQWSNYLADNAEFGMGLKGDPYGFDPRDAALYLYATAMSGDNALDFDEDVTNRMLERAGVTQRVGEVGEGSKAALPTMQTRKYAIPDLLADANAENALNPILDNKNTGYYDRALLASIVAAANADNNGKYGVYDI